VTSLFFINLRFFDRNDIVTKFQQKYKKDSSGQKNDEEGLLP